ncbi:hypothetical protein DV738_g2689, partial [Chaetothyriales sp. CBS 135597]
MFFGRRKSIGKPEAVLDQQPDVKPRTNRLSKPCTNRPFINSTILSSQDLRSVLSSAQASSNASIEGPGGASSGIMPAPMSLEEKRELKTQIFDQDICRDPAKSPTKSPNERPRGGVAMMISKFEANSDSQRTFQPSPPKPKRPLSRIFTVHKASSPVSNKTESPTSQQSDDRARATATSASDTSLASTPIPPSRRASFQPGTATRKSVVVETVQEESDANKPAGTDQLATIAGSTVDDDARSFDEGDDGLWYPPPQMPRTETPNSLDYTHLGRLRLGSLHIVNGRASPAASDMSRLPLAKRDVSSDYGSESGQRDHILSGSRHPLARSREVSGLSSGSINSDAPVNPVATDSLPSIAAVVNTTPAAARKGACDVAAEYISELAPSPYNRDRLSSATRVSVVDVEAETASVHSSPAERKESCRQPSHASSYVTLSESPDSPISAKLETASILQTTTKQTEIDDQLLDDDDDNSTRVGTITPEPGQTPPRTSLDSIQSWHSPIKSDYAAGHEAFDSAVEFQHYSSAAPSPVEGRMDSPVLGRFSDMGQVVLPHQHHSGKSDSGYSSGNSVRSLPRGHTLAPTTPTATRASESDPMLHLATTATEPPPQASSASLPFRPTLESRKTAPADLASFREVQALSERAHTSTEQHKPEAAESTKPKPKKLQKRFLGKKKEALVVQKVASLDCLSVPFVSPEMSAKLEARARELPELERTVESLHDGPNRNSMSDVDISQVNLRFPSPTPEPEQPPKRPGRILSGTLHGPWFGKQKPSEAAKVQPDVSERDPGAIISDFGTVASSIGGSPYDLARGEGHESDMFRGRLNPANISNRMARPKSMFDDHTASELARLRSRTMQEARTSSQRVSSADGRRYTPRQQPETSPMPYLPGQIHPGGRNTQYYQFHLPRRPQHREPPPPPSHSPSPLLVDPEPHFQGLRNSQIAETPRPPSHSPQPTDIPPQMHSASPFSDHAEYQSRGRWNKDKGKAPRPPSHSPHPMDISPRRASPRPPIVDHGQDEDERPPPPSHSPRPMDIWPQMELPRRASFVELQESSNQWDSKRPEREDVGRQWSKDRARGPRPLAPSPRPMSNRAHREEARSAGRVPHVCGREEVADSLEGSFIEPQNFGRYSWNEQVEGPPPAPSRSPRPVDIWPQDLQDGSADAAQQDNQDAWGEQAAMWRARRQSAGEALKRQSWQECGGSKPAWDQTAQQDEPTFPVLPPSPGPRSRPQTSHARQFPMQTGGGYDYHHYNNNNGANQTQRRGEYMLEARTYMHNHQRASTVDHQGGGTWYF